MSHNLKSFYYEASRLNELPDVCQHGITEETSDPETNFDVFWHTVNENYAFFDRRGVDWQATYAAYRDIVTASTSDEELFGIMAAMLEPLQDKHVTLWDKEKDLLWDTSAQNLPEWLDLEAAGEYLEADAGLWSSISELAPEEFAQKYAEAVKQSALLLEGCDSRQTVDNLDILTTLLIPCWLVREAMITSMQRIRSQKHGN
jgi:hypothetical protein